MQNIESAFVSLYGQRKFTRYMCKKISSSQVCRLVLIDEKTRGGAMIFTDGFYKVDECVTKIYWQDEI